MKAFLILPSSFFLASALVLSSCATPPTPEQVQAWSNVGHTIVQNGLQDAKDVHGATHDW